MGERCGESLAWLALCGSFGSRARAPDYRERLPEDEIVYFVLPDRFANGDPANDRGGLAGRPPDHRVRSRAQGLLSRRRSQGPHRAARLHPGAGRHRHLARAYLQEQARAGRPGEESAGYHGYWITDFTSVDPHFGSDADMRAFVDAAHARGMKVYLDIITNHTADVIQYRECVNAPCPYRSRADYPYSRKGGAAGGPSMPGSPATACAPPRISRRLTRPRLRLHAVRAAGRGAA